MTHDPEAAERLATTMPTLDERIEAAKALSGHTAAPWWTDGEYCENEGGIAVIAARTDCGPLPGNPTRGAVAWAREELRVALAALASEPRA